MTADRVATATRRTPHRRVRPRRPSRRHGARHRGGPGRPRRDDGRRELDHHWPDREHREHPEDAGPRVLGVAGGGVRMLHGTDFDVRTGEVVRLAGLQGAGRTELLQAVFGVTPLRTGTVQWRGRD